MKRRTFLQTSALGLASISTAALHGCSRKQAAYLTHAASGYLEPTHALGHRLRKYDLPKSQLEKRVPVLIVGGGVAGLSAAWQLTRNGVKDFALIELEQNNGGNARWASSDVTQYPLGAHYLPLPAQRAEYVRQLLADIGILKGDPNAVAPVYDESALVAAPMDRLFVNGIWQEGLVPRHGFSRADLDQFKRFDDLMHAWAKRMGNDGLPAFVVPSALSSNDPSIKSLDQITFTQWLNDQGLTSEPVQWVANYATRDDYGLSSQLTSAWAGIHYFASRIGRAANANDHAVLTWPAGNGHLVQRLQQWLTQQRAGQFHAQTMAFQVETADQRVIVDAFDAQTNQSTRWVADHVIWASPTFVLNHVWRNPITGFKEAAAQIETRPWLVANLHLNAPLRDELFGQLAWDNVVYGGQGLGYVVATHQAIRTFPGPTVLTYYWPFGTGAAAQVRKQLYESPWQDWAQSVVQELSAPHPELNDLVTHVQITRWGHAMPAPRVGFNTAPIRTMLKQLHPRLSMAHSDLSGLSLFEEANYAGVSAASSALNTLGAKRAG